MNREKLIELAELLEEVHRKERRGRKLYRQNKFFASTEMRKRVSNMNCGTPSCALGWWASKHPKRWRIVAPSERCLISHPVLAIQLKRKQTPFRGPSPFSSACEEFDIGGDLALELFGAFGCGESRSALEAATYVRLVVAREDLRRLRDTFEAMKAPSKLATRTRPARRRTL